MNRRLLALVAILVALPLFAFPIASLPTDPGPRHSTSAHGIGGGDTVDEDRIDNEVFVYDNLTGDERAFFDRVVEGSGTETPLEDLPGRFEMLTDDGSTAPFVRQDGYYYRIIGHVTDPGPPMTELLPRALSFLVAAALLSGAGFLYVNRDG